MDKISVYKEYCTGCGLCKSINRVVFNEDSKGFMYPELSAEDMAFCKNVCPAGGKALRDYQDGNIWGKIENSYYGWASNKDVRYRASSGGVLTALCLFLLDKGYVDGVIQTKRDPLDVRKTITCISSTREEIIGCAGSRYTSSMPLSNIKQIAVEGKKYVFV